jgi:hypothetical protein
MCKYRIFLLKSRDREFKPNTNSFTKESRSVKNIINLEKYALYKIRTLSRDTLLLQGLSELLQAITLRSVSDNLDAGVVSLKTLKYFTVSTANKTFYPER